MVKTLIANMFDSSAQTLVNTVNCVGVMGKGVALEFRKRFPDMYADYVKACAAGQVRLGQPYVYRRTVPPWILNFPTKDDWRSVSKLPDIVAGLNYLEEHYREWEITSLAVPPLGCGQGQLDWHVVGPTLYRHLSRLEIPVELYAPYGTPSEELEADFLTGGAVARKLPARINPAWVALIEILVRIEREPYHWPVGRTIFQKIAYFATELGLPTGLKHKPGSYGPFSPELKGAISRLVNNGLLLEKKLGKSMLQLTPGPTYADAAAMYRSELGQWNDIIERVADLFLRVKTHDAELAATVFFAARTLVKKKHPSELDVLEEVKRWKHKRRPPLRDEEIAHTIRNLNLLHWVSLRPSRELPLREEESRELAVDF
jgi:uncharacterized protein YwgA/O-acetyl-ADP-ribose deacetylase (regulator of RNase III)